MITCTRSLEFDAGHRLLNHEGKCKFLHGHRYRVEVSCEAELDPLGRVIDFSRVKELVGGWIDEHLDHNLILHKDDPLLAHLNSFHPSRTDLFGREPFLMDCNPTAENIALLIHATAITLLTPRGICVPRVRVYETPNCWADSIL